MIPNQLQALCVHFELGAPIKPAQRVYGGLLHSMWRVDTNKASYAIKQLSQEIDLKNQVVVANYNISERIASLFSERGIPAIAALGDKPLTLINGTGFLVYPWVQAKYIDITEKHALKIAVILAKMHALNLHVENIEDSVFEIYSSDYLVDLIEKARACPFAKQLKSHQSDILKANQAFIDAVSVLGKNVVVSHGDLDPKNVLWDDNENPFLIDWESARRLNPTYEIVNASLDWSGITTHFDKTIFVKMIEAYQNEKGAFNRNEYEASFYGVLGNWLHWMVFNIKRSIENSEKKEQAVLQVEQTLATIIRLQNLIPELIGSV